MTILANRWRQSPNVLRGGAALTFCPLLATRHKFPRSIPRAAGLGDEVTALTGKPFNITSSRYRSLVTDYVTPMDKTYTLLGQPKISLGQGVQETVTWLRARPK